MTYLHDPAGGQSAFVTSAEPSARALGAAAGAGCGAAARSAAAGGDGAAARAAAARRRGGGDTLTSGASAGCDAPMAGCGGGPAAPPEHQLGPAGAHPAPAVQRCAGRRRRRGVAPGMPRTPSQSGGCQPLAVAPRDDVDAPDGGDRQGEAPEHDAGQRHEQRRTRRSRTAAWPAGTARSFHVAPLPKWALSLPHTPFAVSHARGAAGTSAPSRYFACRRSKAPNSHHAPGHDEQDGDAHPDDDEAETHGQAGDQEDEVEEAEREREHTGTAGSATCADAPRRRRTSRASSRSPPHLPGSSATLHEKRSGRRRRRRHPTAGTGGRSQRDSCGGARTPTGVRRPPRGYSATLSPGRTRPTS